MYNSISLNLPINDELHAVNIRNIDVDRYISTPVTGTYVLSTLHLYMHETNRCVPFKYLINTIPYRICTEIQLDGVIYEGSKIENTQITVYSHNAPVNTLMGMKLDTLNTCATINLINKTITCNDEVKSYCVFNYSIPIVYTNKVASKGSEFVYFENCIIQHYVNIKYSNIVHPLFVTALRPIYEYIDKLGNDPFQFPITATKNNLSSITYINLRKLKMFFSSNGIAWYTYDVGTSAFISVSPSGTYFSFAELCTNGTDYDTYTSIPIEKFNTTFGVDNVTYLQVLSNGWILPRYIKHTLYSDLLDINEFIWTRDAGARTTMYTGEI